MLLPDLERRETSTQAQKMDDDAWLGRFFIGRGNRRRRRRDEDLVAQQQEEQSLSFCGGGGGPTSFGSNEADPNALDVNSTEFDKD